MSTHPIDVNDVAELVRSAERGHPIPYELGARQVIVHRNDEQVAHLFRETDLDRPVRKRGAVTVHTAEAFTALVRRHATDATVIYADEARFALTAVLNDHAVDGPGWGDHRVLLTCATTKEWAEWNQAVGFKPLETFGDFIDAHVAALHPTRQPSPATMLTIASKLQVTQVAEVKRDASTSGANASVTVKETLDASITGDNGSVVQVPSEFFLAIAPFVGGPEYEIPARLRVRNTRGTNKSVEIGFWLDTAHDVKLQAFRLMVAQVTEAFDPDATSTAPLVVAAAAPEPLR